MPLHVQNAINRGAIDTNQRASRARFFLESIASEVHAQIGLSTEPCYLMLILDLTLLKKRALRKLHLT